jgi:ATP-dependent RNA helicase DDX46/PRP5
MAGRDVIGIAKTGSGKTLAFVLPLLRHISDQPPLAPGETGPIGLILAPARELAYQIHVVCKGLAKHLGFKSTAVYGGAEVREQIADLKRGTHILCATPGRLIDILTMQSGKLISLQRVSFVCCDESDRAFDMGFEPQITAILSAVRPDRQTVLFSATFPKTVENLAKKSLRAPLEIIVGGRSVASDSVEQYAEVVEEQDKFLRLLQLLGEHSDEGKKVIVFVGKQDQADSIFEQLTRCGYSSLSIHGGMDQEDRNSNMSDFKRADGPSILVATSVAGRGLDVPSCGCVINYSSPNHYEDYVHRIGRTGRAGNHGVAYTFVNSTEEAKFAPSIVRAIVEAGQSKNISQELKDLAESFKAKVAKGEAKWASSGYKGKGYTYDSSEMNETQKLAKLEKRQALIEAGLLDPDEDNDDAGELDDDEIDGFEVGKPVAEAPTKEQGVQNAFGILANVSSDVLAIPGMREALMRKAGMLPAESATMTSTGDNHFVEELEINDYPQQARWKVTQKETTSRLQDEFQTAVTLKGQYIEPGKTPTEGERKLYLHLEAQSSMILQNCIVEIKRLLNEETLKVGARSLGGGGRYNVLS